LSQAVLLDRDGTLIHDKHYLDTPEGVEWHDGAFEALRRLEEAGYRLFVVTNQSGVARGKMTEEDVQSIHERMRENLQKNDIVVEDFYYCPYLEDAKDPEYRRESNLRKPSPGMLLEAKEDYDLDLTNSYMIGDKPSDVEAGARAGTSTILVNTGKDVRPDEFPADYDSPDHRVDSLPEASRVIRTTSPTGSSP
jgi:D-glycero-D-manno-heptose 1,7-bisphosphate phosphatase